MLYYAVENAACDIRITDRLRGRFDMYDTDCFRYRVGHWQLAARTIPRQVDQARAVKVVPASQMIVGSLMVMRLEDFVI